MATIQRFEEMEVWKKGRALVNDIYRATAQDPFSTDFALRDQIRKAAISIPSNIAEGFERDRCGEFIQFLRYAKASAGEVRSHLYHAHDQDSLDDDCFRTLQSDAESISRQIQGFIQYLHRTR